MQIALDITELVNNPVRTGIQRVVRELIRCWPDRANLRLTRFEPARGLVSLPNSVMPLLIESAAPARSEQPRVMRGLIAEKLGEWAPAIPDEAMILVPELFYDPARCAWYGQFLRRHPSAVSFIIHDFIPWLYPHSVGVTCTAPFMPYLQLVRSVSRVAFTSGQVRADYHERIKRDARDCSPVIPLGADGLSLERQSFRSNRRTWVAIGSIDGRKNQESIVTAFRKLWCKDFDGELVLIGRVFESASSAWLRDALNDPRLRHLADVPDEVVRTELRHARATIYVSGVEGFGLPPVESLYAGIPVIVTSSIPSISDLPEAGQIRLASPGVLEISEAVEATADDATAERLWTEAATLQLPPWRDFATRVFRWIQESFSDNKGPPEYGK